MGVFQGEGLPYLLHITAFDSQLHVVRRSGGTLSEISLGKSDLCYLPKDRPRRESWLLDGAATLCGPLSLAPR